MGSLLFSPFPSPTGQLRLTKSLQPLGCDRSVVDSVRTSLGQGEGDYVRSRSNSNVLLVIEGVRHGRGMWGLVGFKGVKNFSGSRIRNREVAIVGAKKYDTAGRGEYASPSGSVARLRDLPHRLAGVDVERAQDALSWVCWVAAERSRHVTAAQLEWHVRPCVDAALVIGLHVVQLGH